MLKTLVHFVLAYAVEQILWGESIEVQRAANRAAGKGARFVLKDRKLRMGYPLYIGGTATIERCTLTAEMNWRKRFARGHEVGDGV